MSDLPQASDRVLSYESVHPRLASSRRWRGFLAVLAVLLFAASGVYLSRAFAIYLTAYRPPAGCDAVSRWSESHYVLRGKNPYDIHFAHKAEGQRAAPVGQAAATRDTAIEPDLGVPTAPIYPAWSYAFAIPLFPGPLSVARPVYGVIMVVCLILLAAWSWQLGRRWGWPAGAAFAAGALAMSSWSAAVYTGNYPLVVVAALIGALLALQRGWEIMAGLLMGFALIKPTVAGPFFLVLLVDRRFRAAAAALVLVGLGTIVTWALSHTDPWEMVRQMLAVGDEAFGEGYGPVQYLIHAGFSQHLVTPLIGATVGLGGLVAMVVTRQRARSVDEPGLRLLLLFAVAAVTARFWSYHYPYDDNIMVFALLAVGLAALQSGKGWILGWFLVLGVTYWMPPRAGDHLAFQLLQQGVWILSALLLIVGGARWLAVPREQAGELVTSQKTVGTA